jgi:hypothetical protein
MAMIVAAQIQGSRMGLSSCCESGGSNTGCLLVDADRSAALSSRSAIARERVLVASLDGGWRLFREQAFSALDGACQSIKESVH